MTNIKYPARRNRNPRHLQQTSRFYFHRDRKNLAQGLNNIHFQESPSYFTFICLMLPTFETPLSSRFQSTPVSGVSVATTWAAKAQSVYRLAMGWTVCGSNPGGGEDYRTRLDRSWSPPSLIQWPRRDDNHPLPPSAMVKYRKAIHLSPSMTRGTLWGWTFSFSFSLARN